MINYMYLILFCFVSLCVSQNFLVVADISDLVVAMFDAQTFKLKPLFKLPVYDIYQSNCIFNYGQFINCIARTKNADLYFARFDMYNGILVDEYIADVVSLIFDQEDQIYSMIFHADSKVRCSISEIINYNNSIVKYIVPTDAYHVIDVSNLDYDNGSFIFTVTDISKLRTDFLMIVRSDTDGDWKILFNQTVPYRYRIVRLYYPYVIVWDGLIETFQLLLLHIERNTYQVVVTYIDLEPTTTNYLDGDVLYSVMRHNNSFHWVKTDLIGRTYDAKQLPFEVKCILK